MMGEKKNIFQRASEWGVPFGLFLACGGITYIFADYFMPLGILSFMISLATPIVVYKFQRRKFIEDDGFTEHSALWMLGIMLYILGTILASFIIFLVLQYFRPDFMYEQAQTVINAYSQMPDMKDSEMLKVIQYMVDNRLMPSPIETVFNVFWFVTFIGSLTSALTAWLARRSIKKYQRRS